MKNEWSVGSTNFKDIVKNLAKEGYHISDNLKPCELIEALSITGHNIVDTILTTKNTFNTSLQEATNLVKSHELWREQAKASEELFDVFCDVLDSDPDCYDTKNNN